MKITIDWSETKTTSTGKEYKAVTFKDESGAEVKASVWSDAPFYASIAPGSEVDVEVRKSTDGKYTNLVGASQPRTGGAGMMAMKTAQIDKAMDKKARSIHEAQDRSAWMWSKNNASMLVANNDSTKNLPLSEQIDLIVDMATNIYNSEPSKPF